MPPSLPDLTHDPDLDNQIFFNLNSVYNQQLLTITSRLQIKPHQA